MRNGHRITAMALAVLCLLAAFGASSAAVTEVNGEPVVFTVVNDILLDLKADNMPITRGGLVYVPYTVFSNNFYMRSSYNTLNKYLILQNDEKTLIFDITRGFAYDKSMETVYVKAIAEKGQIYVPAQFVSEYFGYTYVWISDGPIVRIKNSVAAYPDSFLSVLFKTRMEAMIAALSETDPTDPEQEPEPEDTTPRVLYLTFDDGPNEASNDIMDTLSVYGYKATFFLVGAQMAANEAVIRRMAVEEHSIGLHSFTHDKAQFYASTDAMLAEFGVQNDLLRRILKTKSRLVRIPYGSSEVEFTQEYRDALQKAGYRYWDWNASCEDTVEGTTAKKITSAAIESLEQDIDPVVLLMHCSALTAEALPDILAYIRDNNFDVRIIRETDTPVNLHGDLW